MKVFVTISLVLASVKLRNGCNANYTFIIKLKMFSIVYYFNYLYHYVNI